MIVTSTIQDFDALHSCWEQHHSGLAWDCVFTIPPWLKAWYSAFASDNLYLRAVTEDETILGIVPLFVREGEARFIGSPDICDYQDFVIAPGSEHAFFSQVLDRLPQDRIESLLLESVRNDSPVLSTLVGLARNRGFSVSCIMRDVSLYLDLPPTWDGYLDKLSTKQHREVNRKLRRLEEGGRVSFRMIEDTASIESCMDTFLPLLRESREDKAEFMTNQMEAFFRSIAHTMAERGLLRMGFLDLDSSTVAAIMCFDYAGTVYLYNSGFDKRYAYLSVGLMSKVLSIKDSIERGRKRYDFLKGAEEYKYRLGGTEIPIYDCHLTLKR
ncbi:MAG: GNAT family N-acetyltransferase [Dehalococcoidia bacterium]|nr:GNAT family N-acetyltransferase [Dehalococcoidia bacterium]